MPKHQVHRLTRDHSLAVSPLIFLDVNFRSDVCIMISDLWSLWSKTQPLEKLLGLLSISSLDTIARNRKEFSPCKHETLNVTACKKKNKNDY